MNDEQMLCNKDGNRNIKPEFYERITRLRSQGKVFRRNEIIK